MIHKQLQEISDKLYNLEHCVKQLQEISHNIYTIRNSLAQLTDDIDNSESMIDDIIFNLEGSFNEENL